MSRDSRILRSHLRALAEHLAEHNEAIDHHAELAHTELAAKRAEPPTEPHQPAELQLPPREHEAVDH